jgi:hypothetical protein
MSLQHKQEKEHSFSLHRHLAQDLSEVAPERIDAYLARHVQQICGKPWTGVSGDDSFQNENTSAWAQESEQIQLPFYMHDVDAAVAIVDLSGESHKVANIKT